MQSDDPVIGNLFHMERLKQEARTPRIIHPAPRGEVEAGSGLEGGGVPWMTDGIKLDAEAGPGLGGFVRPGHQVIAPAIPSGAKVRAMITRGLTNAQACPAKMLELLMDCL